MEIIVNVPDGRSGDWEIITMPTEYREIKCLIHHEGGAGCPVADNSFNENSAYLPFRTRAHGRVLLIGLGLGVVLQAMIDKRDVQSVTVIESELDVIKLCGEYYKGLSKKVKIIHGNAFNYRTTSFFDAILIDIWDCHHYENLMEMEFLRDRWKKNSSYIYCWGERESQHLLRELHHDRSTLFPSEN
ncbi:hypothetical protein [Chryseobacterium sp. 22543]|uniref:hypothetical protein n=1 Tax=Chryseobacterium sp. 22543 TaxID=3453940 RepID=UPI003F876962